MLSSPLATLVLYELRMLLRDRRTILISVVLPVLLMPLFFYASFLAERGREKRQEAETYRYAVTGPESALARELIAAGTRLAGTQATPGTEPVAPRPARLLHLEEVESTAAAADFAAGAVDAYLETRAAVAAEGSPVAEALALPQMRIVYRSNQDASSTAAEEISRLLDEGRVERRRAALDAHGFPVAEDQVAVLEDHDVATAEQRTGATLGRFATLFVLLFLISGGSVVAADTIAGEKERGTLETLLTTSVSRTELVAAKQLVILILGVTIAVVQLLCVAVYVGFGVIEVPASFAVDLSLLKLVVLLLLLLPLAALVASTLLLASGLARTYKEFQIYFFPVFVLLLAPAGAALLPGVELRSGIVLVPIANLAVAVREVLIGETDLPMLALAWGVSMAAAAGAARWTLHTLSTERLITASEYDRGEWEGGAALFPRRVLGWFAVMWVIVFLAASNVPLLAELHGQLLFNLVGVFLGGSLLMIRCYRLETRQALALRPVRPAVWVAVALGAPGLFLSGITLARFSGWLFPIPRRWLEEFTRTLLPPGLPLWELLLILAVLPAVCEEIAFRGVLLHGLRQRFHPVLLCLVVGTVFGLFHMDLARLLPTAFLGTALAAVTLLTGSLYPAIVWHGLNNATAILAEHVGFPLDNLGAGSYAAGIVVAVLAFALLWRYRTPYPGLLRVTPRARRAGL